MSFDPAAPHLLPCWTARVEVAPKQMHGQGPLGGRNVVPITGGSFEGVLAPESDAARPFRGVVLPGGFDLQRDRRDGMRELEAIYHMQTEDGAVIEIRNEALVATEADGAMYRASRIRVEVAEGPYAWLNRRLFLGTVEPHIDEGHVIIRGFVVV